MGLGRAHGAVQWAESCYRLLAPLPALLPAQACWVATTRKLGAGSGNGPALAVTTPGGACCPAGETRRVSPLERPACTMCSLPWTMSVLNQGWESWTPQDDFGTFNFRNLPVLKAANDDVIRKMRDEQMLPPLAIAAEPYPPMHARPMTLAGKPTKSRAGSVDIRVRDRKSVV